MITIIESYVNFSGKFIDADLTEISKQVLEIIESKALDSFSEIDLEYEIHIEEGSLKLRSYVKTAVQVIIVYGGLRGAVQFAYDDAQAVSQWVSEKVKTIEMFQGHPVTYSRSDTGDLNRIRKLLEQADTGLITQQDAIKKASKILNIDTVNDNEKGVLLEMMSSDFESTGKQTKEVDQQDNIITSKTASVLEAQIKSEKPLKLPEGVLPRRRRSVTLTKDSATGDVTIEVEGVKLLAS